jgi:hypothetical protein
MRFGVLLVAGLMLSPLGAEKADAQSAAPARSAAKAPKITGFTFTYPASLKRYPALVRHLEQQKAKAYASYAKEFADADESTDLSVFEDAVTWTVESERPGLIILLGERSSYLGGAHGYGFTDPLIWDSKAGKALRFEGLFTNPGAAKALLNSSYCKALDKARLEMRGEPTDKDEIFGMCPDLYKEALARPAKIVGGKYGRIAVTLAPYVAGSYAEGQFDLSLFIPKGLKALVKPEYRALFPG